MNAPKPEDAIFLPPGVSKVTYVVDRKMTNAGTFTFELEDHTLGNLLRMQLLSDSNVVFVGYRQPHPLQNKIELKVQTNGEQGPPQVVQGALKNLMIEVEEISRKFEDSLSQKEDADV
eukprot:CAMPEP_0113888830 /NCGR_PEP_ID=MMETSP0780_2-20120614/13111_1 /TAXON_ID=652834 /ORGANISM="Palpitomonas bilix" /LENGTH=117 /DNA_ID=CAMNT_0000877765 /DNA_START=227 /DNA_END=576 /DNA_ORIENTATION=+ /assembly_acc=CAM_ASM_000599